MTTDIQDSLFAGTEDAAASSRRALRPRFFYLITAFVFVADQLSKLWIQHTLLWEQTRPILGNSFGLTLTQNTGGAWGLMPERNSLFILFAIGAVLALMFAYHRMPRVDLLVGTAFALALGGALGNLLDRLRYGYVVDFFDVRLIHWPIFNIADSAISLGIVLLLIHFFRPGGAEQEAAQAAPALALPGEETAGSASESQR